MGFWHKGDITTALNIKLIRPRGCRRRSALKHGLIAAAHAETRHSMSLDTLPRLEHVEQRFGSIFMCRP